MNPKTTDKETVLIVDDNPTNLDVLFDYLDEAGFEIFVAEDGEIALERAKHTQPDLILLDVMMPGIDGFETCRCLKSEAETKDIPVIFMTALSDVESKVKGFAVGGVDYITKPFQHEEVLVRVISHLTIRKLQRNLQEKNVHLQREIAQRKQVELELRARNEELDAFAHTVAHDLNNPVAVILGYCELLEHSLTPPEEAKQDLKIITQAAYKMRSIIKELLLLVGVRKAKIVPKPLDMAEIVTVAQQRLVNMIEEYQTQIDLPSDWPIAVGYAPWVEEVWINYLSNAIKYGGQPPHLALGATVQTDGQVRFWVRDNGTGLTPEEQTKLFAEFTQLEPGRAEGHGLGLSIVQRIVQKLGGQVGVESQVGQGSTFYFTLKEASPNITTDRLG